MLLINSFFLKTTENSSLLSLKATLQAKQLSRRSSEAKVGLFTSYPVCILTAGVDKGLNLVLGGPPGVGKTLTAESS